MNLQLLARNTCSSEFLSSDFKEFLNEEKKKKIVSIDISSSERAACCLKNCA